MGTPEGSSEAVILSAPASPRDRGRRIRWYASLALVGVLAIYLAGSWVGAWVLTAPRTRSSLRDQPTWQSQSHHASGGERVMSYRQGPGDAPVVLLGHGFRGSAAQMTPFAELLLDQGFAVWSVDFRGHGQSPPRVVTAGATEAHDLDAVLRDLRKERGDLRTTGYLGLSLGAAAGALSELAPQLAACVLIGMYDELDTAIRRRFQLHLGLDPWPADWLFRRCAEWRTGIRIEHVRPVDSLHRFDPNRLCLVFGRHDRRVGPDAPIRLRQACKEPVTVLFMEADHQGLASLHAAPHQWQRIAEFLAEHLGMPLSLPGESSR